MKEIPGFPGYFATEDGLIYSSKRGGLKKLTQFSKPTDHKIVQIRVKGRPVTTYVHALVCIAFHGPRPSKGVVAHYDGIPSNNNYKNLRWASPKDNYDDSVRHGTVSCRQGASNGRAKLSENDVICIRYLAAVYEIKTYDIARLFGVKMNRIRKIVTRQSWRHI